MAGHFLLPIIANFISVKSFELRNPIRGGTDSKQRGFNVNVFLQCFLGVVESEAGVQNIVKKIYIGIVFECPFAVYI